MRRAARLRCVLAVTALCPAFACAPLTCVLAAAGDGDGEDREGGEEGGEAGGDAGEHGRRRGEHSALGRGHVGDWWANVGGLPVAVCVPMPTPVAMPNLERAAAELTARQEGL